MTFRANKAVSVNEVLEVLATRTQVSSSLGHQLDKMRDGTSGAPPVGDGVNDQALINQANVYRCIDALVKQQGVQWAHTDVLPRYARSAGLPAGKVAVQVVQAYQPWHCDVDAVRPAGDPTVGAYRGPERGLYEVHQWMCAHVSKTPGYEKNPKEARLKAAALLADADIVVVAWVDLWNRNAGFKAWISVAEFSLKYGVPERTVRGWCESGQLPAIMKRGTYRIDVSEISE